MKIVFISKREGDFCPVPQSLATPLCTLWTQQKKIDFYSRPTIWDMSPKSRLFYTPSLNRLEL